METIPVSGALSLRRGPGCWTMSEHADDIPNTPDDPAGDPPRRRASDRQEPPTPDYASPEFAAPNIGDEDEGGLDGLRSRAINSGIWSFAGYLTQQGLRFGGNVALFWIFAHNLRGTDNDPAAIFGIMALVNIAVQGLQMFSDVGIGPAIIQNPRGDDKAFLNTAWTIQVLRGIALWLIGCAIAYPAAWIYDTPELIYLVPVVAINALFRGFDHTAIFQLNRKLQLGKVVALQTLQQIISVILMIVWAQFISSDVWALAVPVVASTLIYTVLTHTFLGKGDGRKLQWDQSAAQELLKFGKWIFVSTTLTFLALQTDRLVFGAQVSKAELGVYTIALMFASLPVMIIQKLGGQVLFPGYARLQHDRPRFDQVYHKVHKAVLMAGALTVAGLFAAGRPMIELIYPPEAHEAGWMLQLLAIMAWFQVIGEPIRSAILALGKPMWLAVANAGKVISLFAGVLMGFQVGSQIDYITPIQGAILGVVLSELVRYALMAIAAHLENLPGLWLDAWFTVLLMITAIGSALAAFHIERSTGSALLAMAVAIVLVVATWAPLAARSVQKARKRE
ncbi:MAG: oligosaccharide flippase family protein [Planctomycetota bacterium]